MSQAFVSWARAVLPEAAPRAFVSWAQVEIPGAASCAFVSWAQIELPDSEGSRAFVSWANVELPLSSIVLPTGGDLFEVDGTPLTSVLKMQGIEIEWIESYNRLTTTE